MRFARLNLLKYGHFEGCDLTFPPDPMDFHLIVGANEAGKSTTLAAVSDLLFGFPKTTPYGFRFAGPLLRLGATLQHGDEDLSIRRRKGNKDTLLDDVEAPIADATLLPFLQGVSADAFRTAHSLDHRRLGEGGRAILNAKDDVGQALFAAGSGLVGVQAALKDLEVEADAIWARQRAGRRTYTQAETELAAAQTRLKAAQVRPKEWVSAKDELERLSRRQAELRDERTARQNDLRKVQRVRRVAPSVQSRAALLGTISGLAASPFEADHERTHDQAVEAISGAQLKRQAAVSAAEEIRDRMAGIVVDDVLLAQREEIDRLVSEAGAARQGAEHLPLRQAELRTLQATVTRLAGELDLDDLPADALQGRLPSRIALTGLQRQAARRTQLETTLQALKDQLGLDEEAAERAQAALAASPDVVEDNEGEGALRDGQRALAVDARLDERRRAVNRHNQALATATARLKPWTGEIAELEALALPGEPEIAAADALMQRADEMVESETRGLRVLEQGLEKLTAERRRFSEGKHAVSVDQVVAARSERDARWRPLRDHLVSGANLDEPIVAAEAFEGAVSITDRVLDERFDTAEASARLADLDDRIATAVLDIGQAKTRVAEAKVERTSRSQAWESRLGAAGLTIMTPPALRQWRSDCADVLRIAADHREAVEALAADEGIVSAARAGLLNALKGPAAAALDRNAPYVHVLDTVQRAVEASNLRRSQRSTLATQAASADEAVASGRRRIDQLAKDIGEWAKEWETAAALVQLKAAAWNTMDVRAPLFERLRGAIDAALEMQRRVAGISDDQQRFEGRAQDVARLCGYAQPGSPPEITQALRLKLQKAVADAREIEGLQSSLDRKLADEREADQIVEAGAARLEPLMLMCGAVDRAALARAIEDSRSLRQARTDILALEQSILKDGDGHPLERLLEEAQGFDPEAVQGEADRLEEAIAELDTEVAIAAQSVGEAKQIFHALDHGDDAALAAADAEQARSAMAAEAEAYLIRKAQVVMLKWGVEKYRQRRQNPLLARASQFFATLTLGRYTDLQIDLDDDQPRLVGLCADGASTVTVEGMSDGTADQLFLALRLAALEQSLETGIALPFLADDLFINFDDKRAHAGFKVLGELARKTQVLFFTHHEHLRKIAEDALRPNPLSTCEFL
jgi:uncharacterized protein YhaN